jgi:uncharacterized damage-inducible protein DinB
MSEQKLLLQQFEQELKTTLKILKAYPADKPDIKPAEKSRTAKDLIWTMVQDIQLAIQGLKGTIDWESISAPSPGTIEEMIKAFEDYSKKFKSKLKNMKPDKFKKSKVEFFVAPGKTGKILVSGLAWLLLKDQIHHRGQLSVYYRVAGAKLPSIYGPTADEPWH